MFDVFLDYVKKLLKSRLFPITLIYIALFSVIIYKLFVLQIVHGPTIAVENDLKYSKDREIKSTRGNIYDRNGVLLAYNVLSNSINMEDITVSDEEYNAIVYKLIKIIERNGDTLDNEFYIRLNKKGELEFTVEGTALERFKKNAYAYVLDDKKQLTDEQKEATAEQVFEFLRNGTGNDYTNMFGISEEYSTEDALKIMGVRYALFCNYPKYLQVTVASKVSDATVAAVKESNAELKGVEVQQQTSRVYEDSLYFAHIIGYTGLISADELTDHEDKGYNMTDVIGKTGLEAEYEEYLAGKKGTEKVTVNASGKVVNTVSSTDPVAGNDIYLTIDSELQKNVYHLLEREIASILLQNIVPNMDYGSKGESASDITIPIYEVYNALINNNIIDINQFDDKNAKDLEKKTYQKYKSAMKDIMSQYDQLLSMDSTVANKDAGEMEDFLDYFYQVMVDYKILMKKSIPADDATYLNYKNGSISLSSFLQYAIANNWIDLSILGVGDEYYSAEELYNKLISYTKSLLTEDSKFNKMIYRNLIFSYNLSGTEICLLLFDQGVLEYNEDDVNRLISGDLKAYDFIRNKISSLEITPGMLALEPCSGSVVITDVKSGDVLALVTYPSYDNNMFANKINSAYYSQLLNDAAYPLNNRPLTQKLAPGSTFKMVTSFAALQEGITNPTEHIRDLGEFDKIFPPAKCHVYPSNHGSVDIIDAIKVSCNYFFYEMGWRLSIDGTGKYTPDLGLSKLKKYASMFGLDEKSGIELYEAEPQSSSKDAVRSAIGQGNNAYTPAQLSRYVTTLANRGTCYNLTLLDKIEDKDGNVVLDNSATVNHDLTDFSQSNWDTVLEGMYSVVNVSGGSVYNQFKDFPITVAGKTGTSQVSRLSPNNALFVSYAPYQNPEISVTAVIPNGYTSHNAAALCKNIYSLYFGISDAETLLKGNVSDNAEGSSGSLE